MHCSPLIGPPGVKGYALQPADRSPQRSLDDMDSSLPASGTRRGPGSKTRGLAAEDPPGADVAGRSQRSHFKWVRVAYVIRSLGSCGRCSACLFFLDPSVAKRLALRCIAMHVPSACPFSPSTSGSSAACAALPALNPATTHAHIKTRFITVASTASATSQRRWAWSTPSALRSRTQVRKVAAASSVSRRVSVLRSFHVLCAHRSGRMRSRDRINPR
jgi:hypothetical protein